MNFISNQYNRTIAVVAILRDEERFLDEWICYHRILGVDHFFLYDDSSDLLLQDFLYPYREYVTVIPWYKADQHLPGINRQTKAYWHAVEHFLYNYDWVSFIDGDEFIVLRCWENVKLFLDDFNNCDAILLNWHVFGHNGYFDDPEGLVTAKLLRRMFKPSMNVKSITKVSSIISITSAHFCKKKKGSISVDANKNSIVKDIYDGITDRAHINHYQCRSFSTWMKRVKRGDPYFDSGNAPIEHNWRLDEQECLRKFVETIAYNKNEYVDEYMLKYEKHLNTMINEIRNKDSYRTNNIYRER